MSLEMKFKKCFRIAQEQTLPTSGSAGSDLCSSEKKFSSLFLAQHFQLIYK